MRSAEYPHACRWCAHTAPTYALLVQHVEGWHPVEHWDWLGALVTETLRAPRIEEDTR